ncbi:hypothetical protein ENC19_26510 [Verrucosispora sp. CWR15]|uniref:Uncharacterized protein n=1 Tax=Verrucosispora sioxanthis TaxID=2499994 RepID=A0A6M1LCR8_9ACTN|nr:hypothetical protein [Verrucosispora sioxanthis]NEE66824.1 hypothetical protein [Verrucosispora sioxanthis]NGM15934.1 hypothetical protein [Verrucosispora sioxanthis]
MRRSNLPASSAAGAWEALVLDVGEPTRPALRVEAAGGGLLVLRRGDAVLLLANVADDHFGVAYVATGHHRSPVPPTSAARAAAVGTADAGGAGLARWAHHFATALTGTGDGPLHAGRWVIAGEPAQPDSGTSQRRMPVPLPQHRGWIDWFGGDRHRQILPLRPLASPGDSRVKAYRKQFREGVLPPVLLWWISGLDCHVVLDGHDRLAAALAEDGPPPLLRLSSVSQRQVDADTDTAVRRYATTTEAVRHQVAAGTPGAADALAATHRRFARELGGVGTGYGTSRAWPLRGGPATWHRLAEAHAPDWHAEISAADDGYGRRPPPDGRRPHLSP